MAKYSLYTLLAAAFMALLYVTMSDTAEAPTTLACADSAAVTTPPMKANCIETVPQSSGISWPAWLVGADSLQFHYLDLLELLFSAPAAETPSSTPSSSTRL
jgi:hypothetical protein